MSSGTVASPEQLNDRELQTLRHLVMGRSEKEVARATGLSVNTVHMHVKRIYRAYRVHSRAELLVAYFSRVAAIHAGESAVSNPKAPESQRGEQAQAATAPSIPEKASERCVCAFSRVLSPRAPRVVVP